MMIISCQNCSKKFDVEDNLIPENGRMLQCSSCDYKWFFKTPETTETITLEEIISADHENFDKNEQNETNMKLHLQKQTLRCTGIIQLV